jgi:hypothetical protein
MRNQEPFYTSGDAIPVLVDFTVRLYVPPRLLRVERFVELIQEDERILDVDHIPVSIHRPA